MKIKYYGKFFDVTDSLKEYADKKIAKLEWFFGPDAGAQVKFAQEKGGRNICEITVNDRNMLFRAEEICPDMYASIDKAADKLTRQIRRHRTKLDKKLHAPAPEIASAPEPVFADDVEEEEERKIVRVKRFAIKPMSVDDAIIQMEMLGHSFYLFENADEDRMCVLYRRQDGNYGLLEPEAR